MVIPIDPNRKYAPSEIYRNGFILNTLGKRDLHYVYHLIRIGRLRAENVCQGKFKKYFKVLGSDIIKWKQTTDYTIQEQPTVQPKKMYPRENRPYPQAHTESNE